MKFLFLCVFSLLGTNVQGINNGELAPINEHKYAVTIHTRSDVQDCTISACTGSIIHEKFILTAAHCFTKRDKSDPKPDGSQKNEFKNLPVTVYANTDALDKTDGAVERKVKGVYLRSEWLANGIDADIAVVELYTNLGIAKHHLQVLQLPSPIDTKDPKNPQYNTYADEVALFAGYGKDLKGSEVNKHKLKRMFAKIHNFDSCKRYNNPIYKAWKEDHVLCGKAVEKISRRGSTLYEKPSQELGTCDGDSGGPLVLNGNTLIGVLSRSKPKCDDREAPAVYMRVSHYKDFIQAVIDGKLRKEHNAVYKSLTMSNAFNRCARRFVNYIQKLLLGRSDEELD